MKPTDRPTLKDGKRTISTTLINVARNIWIRADKADNFKAVK
jgi:hypothetical protein